MSQRVTWPIHGAVMGISLAACGVTGASGVCPSPPDGGFGASGIGPAESAASGTLEGAVVDCSLCNFSAVEVVQALSGYYTLYLSSTAGGEGTCTLPKDSSTATFSTFSAGIPLSGMQPGTFSSSQSIASSICPNIQLDYNLPGPPPSTDCQGAVGPDCPAGCAEFECAEIDSGSGEYCPCQVAGAPLVSYGASGACGAMAAVGSWQVVLTSVVPYAGDAGLLPGSAAYTVHGSITADLVGATGDGGPPAGDHAGLSLTF